MPFLVFAVLLLSGCAAGSGGPACRPAGEWFLDIEAGKGSCLQPGMEFYEYLRIETDGARYRAFWSDGSELDYVSFSSEGCTVDFIRTFNSLATPEGSAVSGHSVLRLEIADDSITGTNDIIGEDCEQEQTITGGRI